MDIKTARNNRILRWGGLLALALLLLLVMAIQHERPYIEEDEPGRSVSGNQDETLPPETALLESPLPETTEEVIPLPQESETPLPAEEEAVASEVPISLYSLQMLSANEAVVYSFAEFKEALETNAAITTVYLGADITLQEGGVRIHSDKSDIIISGKNPLDGEQAERHTLTDHSSGSYLNTIFINKSSTKSILVTDLHIVGKNYYGPVCVMDALAMSGTLLRYQRVDYSGPQIGYHRQGTVHFIDCNIRLTKENGGSPQQEVTEVKYLRFEGNNVVDVASNTLSLFWHPAGGSFSLANGAHLTVNAPGMPAGYGIFYADAGKLTIDIGQRAVFRANISGTVTLDGQTSISGLTVQEGGSFFLTTTKSATLPVLIMEGNTVVEGGANFRIDGYGGTLVTVLDQQSGNITVAPAASFQIVAATTYARLLDLYRNSFVCDDPALVLFYNPDKRPIQALGTAAKLQIAAQQINYREVAAASSLNNPPKNRWQKTNGENVVFQGNLAIGSSGELSLTTANYTPGETPLVTPSASTFSMVKGRVFAFGRLSIHAEISVSEPVAISGYTEPGAKVRASFTQGSKAIVLPEVTADKNGVFNISVDSTLTIDSPVIVESSYQYLYAKTTVYPSKTSELSMTVPEAMHFYTTKISAKNQTVPRMETHWNILIHDTRGADSAWRLYARLKEPLTKQGENSFVVPNALVFASDTGAHFLESTVYTEIASNTGSAAETSAAIHWAENRGILLFPPPGILLAGSYAAKIEWVLVDAP